MSKIYIPAVSAVPCRSRKALCDQNQLFAIWVSNSPMGMPWRLRVFLRVP